MTRTEAVELNKAGTATGGCWRCIQNEGPAGKTQWKMEVLKFIGHRQFCPLHYDQEFRDARGF